MMLVMLLMSLFAPHTYAPGLLVGNSASASTGSVTRNDKTPHPKCPHSPSRSALPTRGKSPQVAVRLSLPMNTPLPCI
jgi:hypothetical protein